MISHDATCDTGPLSCASLTCRSHQHVHFGTEIFARHITTSCCTTVFAFFALCPRSCPCPAGTGARGAPAAAGAERRRTRLGLPRETQLPCPETPAGRGASAAADEARAAAEAAAPPPAELAPGDPRRLASPRSLPPFPQLYLSCAKLTRLPRFIYTLKCKQTHSATKFQKVMQSLSGNVTCEEMEELSAHGPLHAVPLLNAFTASQIGLVNVLQKRRVLNF